MGLEINIKKRNFMIVSRNPYNGNECINLGTYNFEIVNDYTYLDKILINKSDLRPETENKDYECK